MIETMAVARGVSGCGRGGDGCDGGDGNDGGVGGGGSGGRGDGAILASVVVVAVDNSGDGDGLP